MEASPSDLSVSSIVLQSPERFFDRRLSVRVHIAGNKKVQLSALRLQAVPRSCRSTVSFINGKKILP